MNSGVEIDWFDSGLFLDEPLEAGEKVRSQMGERLGESQYDIEVIYSF